MKSAVFAELRFFLSCLNWFLVGCIPKFITLKSTQFLSGEDIMLFWPEKNATVTKKIQKDYCNEELFENTRKQTDILSENIKEWIDDLEFIFCNAYFTCLDRKKSHRH